ncbi:TPA: hypothetical protein U2D23_000686 [Streptococcus suis]|nr:hypothetical protein [Streptococcus suis]HEM6345615.1 hypothetical protein [Streptococcus suis]
MAKFSAAILNDVRTEFGLPKVTVTQSAQEFAKKVVDTYNEKNVAFLTHGKDDNENGPNTRLRKQWA